MSKKLKCVISLLVIFLSSAILTFLIHHFNCYPIGNDVYGHLFRIEQLYNTLKSGVFYPVYTRNWYSGFEMFRYWPPLSHYFCCIFMFLTNGNTYLSYLLFIFATFFIGGCGWLLFCNREDRWLAGTFFAVAYMIFPDNIRVLLTEGNVSRILITAMLPYFFYCLCELIKYKNFKALKWLCLLLFFITIGHFMISAMLGVTTFLCLFLYSITHKEIKREFYILGAMGLTYVADGIVLVPGLIGGIMSQSSSAVDGISVTQWSEEMIVSLNPIMRFTNTSAFYFGLSIFIILVLGILVCHRDTLPFFGTTLTIYIGTTMIVLPIISALPVSQVFWMVRFIPITMCVFVVGLFYWKQLKPVTIIIFGILLCADSAISSVYLFEHANITTEVREAKIENMYLLDEACDITVNQLAIMDCSEMGSYPAYYVTKDNRDVKLLFGWAYQGAYSLKEIVTLNEAFQYGFYPYVFDRLEGYCCDTVLIKKDEVRTDYEGLLKQIEISSYDIVDENDYVLLLHNNQTSEYGVVQNYENVCIGSGSESLACIYPSFYKLRNEYLDEYTFDELKDYKKIYLSGHYYKNKDYCEQLVLDLSNYGVHIYIDMNNLQEEKSTGRNSFLGVYAQPIVFNDIFPIIELKNGSQFKINSFAEEYSEWKTVYFTNLKDVDRYAVYKDDDKVKNLAYLGTGVNPNLTFIGFNLVYYDYVQNNDDLNVFLDEVFEEDRTFMADKTYVPIQSDVVNNIIHIHSDYDNVDIAYANLDTFISNQNLGKETYVKVNHGDTLIHVTYAQFSLALFVTLIGVFLLLVWYNIVRKLWMK